MKNTLKLLALAGILGGAASAEAADYTVRICGATAFRNNIHAAIQTLFGSDTICHNHASALNSATRSIIRGTYGGDTVTVKMVWLGSAHGVSALASGTDIDFLSDAGLGGVGTTTPNYSTPETTHVAADFALSDVRQESTTAANAPTLDTSYNVAVVPFTWLKNATTIAGVTNVDGQKARLLFTSGFAPAWIFTGNPANTQFLILTGRNDESGTRGEALAETQYGTATPVRQFYASAITKPDTTADTPSAPTNGGTITTLTLWPTTGYGLSSVVAEGNGGYTSGSFVRSIMTKTSAVVTTAASSPAIHPGVSGGSVGLLTYIGMGDATAAITANPSVSRLSYEGVSYDDTLATVDRVYRGQYTYWSYEVMYEKNGGAGVDTFRDDLLTTVEAGLGVGTQGLKITDMQVSRSEDGGLVGP
jgi:hypothetical protein